MNRSTAQAREQWLWMRASVALVAAAAAAMRIAEDAPLAPMPLAPAR